MGAGRRAAASIMAYLGIGEAPTDTSPQRLFGIPTGERNYARLRIA